MESNYKEQIIEVASSWWAEVIKDAKLDCGADSYDGLLASFLGEQLKKPIKDEESELFKNKLKEYINKEYDEQLINSTKRSIILSCDYGPDKNLYEIAQECNISVNNFPWKTTMWIGKNFCQVRYGYGASLNTLFESKEHLLKLIEDNKEEIKYYKDKPDNYFTIYTREDMLKEAQERLDESIKNYQKFMEENNNEENNSI